MALWSARARPGQVCDWCGDAFRAAEIVLIEENGCNRHDQAPGCTFRRYLEREKEAGREQSPYT